MTADPEATGASATLGVISDTHGLLRPEAVAALDGVDGILHAGDVDRPGILERLDTVAPLLGAVRGNVDRGDWARELPRDLLLDAHGHSIYMIHDLGDLDLDPDAAGIGVVVYGHSHRPLVEVRDGLLYLNPGSAGPRRFDLPVTLAMLELGPGLPAARIVPLVD